MTKINKLSTTNYSKIKNIKAVSKNGSNQKNKFILNTLFG